MFASTEEDVEGLTFLIRSYMGKDMLRSKLEKKGLDYNGNDAALSWLCAKNAAVKADPIFGIKEISRKVHQLDAFMEHALSLVAHELSSVQWTSLDKDLKDLRLAVESTLEEGQLVLVDDEAILGLFSKYSDDIDTDSLRYLISMYCGIINDKTEKYLFGTNAIASWVEIQKRSQIFIL